MNVNKESYQIDLREMRRLSEGTFPCPKCGTVISPDDETEELYTIIEAKIEHEMLERLTIACKKCGSRIELLGLSYNPPPRSKIRKKYQKLRPLYEQLIEEVEFILINHLKRIGLKVHNTTHRVKTFNSFYEKIIQKQVEGDPFTAIKDIAGVRTICLYRKDLKRIGDLVAKEFNVVYSDTSRTRSEEQMGYMSDHYMVSHPEKCKGARYDKIKNLYCEIQIRTILMHAWASVSHHLDYKKETDIPFNLRKDFNALSGLFYVADTHFEIFREGIENAKSDMIKATKKAKFNLNQEVNLDSLRVYLAWKFPNRRAGRIDSSLLNNLREMGLRNFAFIDKTINRNMLMLEKIESSKPKKRHLDREGVLFFSLWRHVTTIDTKSKTTKPGTKNIRSKTKRKKGKAK